MLDVSEIQQLITEDKASEKKALARKGQAYYDGDHDIKDYRLFYYNADGILVEDKTRSNVKIPHAFFAELVDQTVQYIFSGGEFVRSDIPELQSELNRYFNYNEDFLAELSDTLTGCIAKGFEYMYAYKNSEDRISFQHADCIGVTEVRANDTDSDTEYVIYSYADRIEKGHRKITRIQVWDREKVYFYVQTDNGRIETDETEKLNPRPHTLYTKGKKTYFKGFGFIPFFRLDNNKKQFSGLKPIKGLIDDYDLMASSLSNNLIDFDTPIHVVKGFEGDNLDELQQNLKTKKVVGVDENGGVEVHTIDVPYQARQAKLELDEKNIYRFGMGLNTSGLKDTNATTNIAIRAAYSLLDLKTAKLEIRIKQFLRKLLKPVLEEINERSETDYQSKDVYFEFRHEIMSNAQENAQIDLTRAQEQQTRINTLLNLAAQLDNETLMQNICDVLDIDYEEIRDKLPEQAGQLADTALKAVSADE
ncbi:MAG: phage portal protein [Porcipelethomonas sp.]